MGALIMFLRHITDFSGVFFQPCPENSEDFRISQCNQFNKIAFRGRHYNWVPFSGSKYQYMMESAEADSYNAKQANIMV